MKAREIQIKQNAIKVYVERSMIQLQYVNKGKLNKCIYIA